MPIGDFAAGEGPAGLDPVVTSPARVVALAPAAAIYDPALRDWLRDENGDPVPTHPVDQQFALAMFFAARSLRSVPSIGNTTSEITHIDALRHENMIKDRLMQAASLLTRLRRAEVIRIVFEPTEKNRTLATVVYRNLVTTSTERYLTVPR